MDIDVPGDVSITGFDDLELASHVSPALTTAHVPVEAMGRAEFLLARIDKRPIVAKTRLDVTLVVRDTTGPVRAS